MPASDDLPEPIAEAAPTETSEADPAETATQEADEAPAAAEPDTISQPAAHSEADPSGTDEAPTPTTTDSIAEDAATAEALDEPGPSVAKVDVPADPEDDADTAPSTVTSLKQHLRSTENATLTARKSEIAPVYERLVALRSKMGG